MPRDICYSRATCIFLECLRQQASGELVRLAVVEGDDLIWVAKAQGARTGLRYDPDAGLEIYFPATANGLAFLAAVDEDRTLTLVSRQGMDHARETGPGAPQTLRALMEQIAQTKERGFAVVFDAYEAGTSAVAAAIRIDDRKRADWHCQYCRAIYTDDPRAYGRLGA